MPRKHSVSRPSLGQSARFDAALSTSREVALVLAGTAGAAAMPLSAFDGRVVLSLVTLVLVVSTTVDAGGRTPAPWSAVFRSDVEAIRADVHKATAVRHY